MATDGFRSRVSWKGGNTLPARRRVRLDVHFIGIRPEDGRLHAIYIGDHEE